MRFAMEPRPVEWAAQAPVRIERTFDLPALPGDVWAVLSDLGGWDRWFGGMRRIDVLDDRRRDVWVGAAGVREHFTVWEEGARLGFTMEAASIPGLGSMVEDWRIEPAGSGTKLAVVVAAEGAGVLRRTPKVIDAILRRSTAGAAGITSCWRAPSGGPTPAGG
jgi:carbon monoxide dehydrogenase subunit G